MADEQNPQRPYIWKGSEGGFISRKTAKEGVLAYRNSEASKANGGTHAHYMGGEKVRQLLLAPGAVGLRVYYAKSQSDDPTRHVKIGDADVYLVPVDSAGNNIFVDENGNSMIMDISLPCPVWCPKEDL